MARAAEQPRKKGGSPTPLLILIEPSFGHSASLRSETCGRDQRAMREEDEETHVEDLGDIAESWKLVGA